MDFFSAQDQARAKTRTLIVYFVLAVAGIVAAIYFAAVLSLSILNNDSGTAGQMPIVWWQPQLFLFVLISVVAVVGISTVSKIVSLRSGGGVVARSLGGRRIQPNTRDPAERRLLNVVEEMAIASGCPVPEVYLLDKEDAINGFAAGYTPHDAAIAVTRGCLEKLNRDELQGVIAHEFSHIMNGDMRMNIRLMGVLFGVLVLAVAGRTLMEILRYMPRRRSNDKDSSGAIMLVIFLIGLSLFVIGYIGVFFGRLIQAGVSRQREYLADAAAVQYTRNPSGIAGALRKIGGESGSLIQNPHAQEAAHFFFANSLRFDLAGLLATHPPLKERIARIEGEGGILSERKERQPQAKEEFAPKPKAGRVGSKELIASIGVIGAAQLSYAESIQQSIDKDLRDEVHDPEKAQLLLFALLLDPDPGERAAQLNYLEKELGSSVRDAMGDLYVRLRRLPVTSKLPLVEMTIPALSMLDKAASDRFEARLKALAEMDKSVTMFEFALLQVVRTQLRRKLNPTGASPISNANVLAPAFFVVLSSLIYAEERSEEEYNLTFEAAIKEAPHFLGRGKLLSKEEADFRKLEEALDQLANASNRLKREILSALAQAVVWNGVIEENELEILRTVSICMDCPMPPLQ